MSESVESAEATADESQTKLESYGERWIGNERVIALSALAICDRLHELALRVRDAKYGNEA